MVEPDWLACIGKIVLKNRVGDDSGDRYVAKPDSSSCACRVPIEVGPEHLDSRALDTKHGPSIADCNVG